MISEKSSKLINDFAIAVTNNSRTLNAEYIEREETAEKALVDYIAYIEAENAELRSYRDGYDTRDKLPEEGQKVLVIKDGMVQVLIFHLKVWNTSPFGKFNKWWPLPKGGG